jgi:hypothetical protein
VDIALTKEHVYSPSIHQANVTESWNNKLWLWVPRGSESGMTVLARGKSNLSDRTDPTRGARNQKWLWWWRPAATYQTRQANMTKENLNTENIYIL